LTRSTLLHNHNESSINNSNKNKKRSRSPQQNNNDELIDESAVVGNANANARTSMLSSTRVDVLSSTRLEANNRGAKSSLSVSTIRVVNQEGVGLEKDDGENHKDDDGEDDVSMSVGTPSKRKRKSEEPSANGTAPTALSSPAVGGISLRVE